MPDMNYKIRNLRRKISYFLYDNKILDFEQQGHIQGNIRNPVRFLKSILKKLK